VGTPSFVFHLAAGAKLLKGLPTGGSVDYAQVMHVDLGIAAKRLIQLA
jgi:hypothetical protein